jgi:hypothetical protein
MRWLLSPPGEAIAGERRTKNNPPTPSRSGEIEWPVQRPEPSEGACGEQKRRFSLLEGPAKALSSVRETGRNSEVGAIPPRFDPADGRHLGHVTSSTNPSRGRSNAHDLRPLCLVDRVSNPIPRPREGWCDRRSVEPGDKRCPGVFEPGLRSPPPHRWRATPRLTGLSGRCVCIRSGSLRRRNTPIALEPATIEGLFPSFENGAPHPRDASEQRREKTDRPTARSIGREDKRSITAVCDLVS